MLISQILLAYNQECLRTDQGMVRTFSRLVSSFGLNITTVHSFVQQLLPNHPVCQAMMSRFMEIFRSTYFELSHCQIIQIRNQYEIILQSFVSFAIAVFYGILDSPNEADCQECIAFQYKIINPNDVF